MGLAWLLLCGISHVTPILLIYSIFAWFIQSSKDGRRPMAQTIGYGLFVAHAVFTGVVALCSPSVSGYYNPVVLYFYGLLTRPHITLNFVPGGGEAMGAFDYVKAIQRQALPSDNNLCLRIHLYFAMGWSLCMPMQFFYTLRHNNKLAHRIFGRVGILCSIGSAITAIINPHVKAGELHYQIDASLTTRDETSEIVPSWYAWTPIAIYTLFCACKAFFHAYRREIPLHRVWVVRNLSGGLTVGIMRVVAILWTQFVFPTCSTGDGFLPSFVSAVVIAFILATISIEIYIRCYTNNGAALPPLTQTWKATTLDTAILPAQGRPETCVLFMLLAFFGAVYCGYNVLSSADIKEKLVPSLVNPTLLFEMFVDFHNRVSICPISAAIALDVFLALSPYCVFCAIEARRYGLRMFGLHVVVASFFFSSVSFPFFLWRRAVQRLAPLPSVAPKAGSSGNRWCLCVMAFSALNFAASILVYCLKGQLTIPVVVGWHFVIPAILYHPSLGVSEPVATQLPRWAIVSLHIYCVVALVASAYSNAMAAGAFLRGSTIEGPAGKSFIWDRLITTAAAILVEMFETPWLSSARRASLALLTAIAPGSGFCCFLIMRETTTDFAYESLQSN